MKKQFSKLLGAVLHHTVLCFHRTIQLNGIPQEVESKLKYKIVAAWKVACLSDMQKFLEQAAFFQTQNPFPYLHLNPSIDN